MKKIIRSLLFLVIIELFGISNVYAANNPYKESGPYGINCTWYTWKMANEKAGVTLPGWGDAKEWYNDAKNHGYSVGTTPKSNSIIVWGDWTSYGHVGYVERVEGNILYVWDSTGPCIDREDEEFKECMANGVSEESDKICYANAKKIACEYTISPSEYTITGYIYLDEAPKKTITTTEKTKNVGKEKSKNCNLSKITLSYGEIEFDKNILKYDLEVDSNIDKIEINAIVEDEKSKVEGNGIYDLKVGINVISLKVTAEDGSTKKYDIRITKKEKVEEKIEVKNNKLKRSEKIVDKNIMIFSVFIILLIIIATIIIKKILKNNRN